MELRMEHLSKGYDGVPVLEDVSLTLPVGITCLMAPSGRGKTTLLRLLLGLETADGGTISGLDGLRRAAVFQEDRLLDGLTARENVAFVLPRGAGDRGALLLEELGLESGDTRPVSAYSGGMRRRVALARALAAEYDLLVLDEPFTGLDEDSRRQAIACIKRCAAGKIVLLVSHSEEDAAQLHAPVVKL